MYGTDVSRLQNLRGHRLPVGASTVRSRAARALVVGDAAGLVDPFSEDGIYEAFSAAARRRRGATAPGRRGRASGPRRASQGDPPL